MIWYVYLYFETFSLRRCLYCFHLFDGRWSSPNAAGFQERHTEPRLVSQLLEERAIAIPEPALLAEAVLVPDRVIEHLVEVLLRVAQEPGAGAQLVGGRAAGDYEFPESLPRRRQRKMYVKKILPFFVVFKFTALLEELGIGRH